MKVRHLIFLWLIGASGQLVGLTIGLAVRGLMRPEVEVPLVTIWLAAMYLVFTTGVLRDRRD